MASLKYSRQRESIKEFLMGRTDHPTADVVYENMKLIYPNISLGTVYRNLSLLADIGEIKKLPSFGGADRFDFRTDQHSHFICTKCGRIMDIDTENIDQLLEKTASKFESGQVLGFSARFFGICEDCLKKEKN
ncbi:transcriptional repressor [Ruminococcus sp. 5_1_39BFAA]|uniref:Fur family transcriptional regulator n=1 Tax=Ruminococcus sp. 5_1_39BFAA TaxID=457412 RepID=UPI0035638B53